MTKPASIGVQILGALVALFAIGAGPTNPVAAMFWFAVGVALIRWGGSAARERIYQERRR